MGIDAMSRVRMSEVLNINTTASLSRSDAAPPHPQAYGADTSRNFIISSYECNDS